MTFTYTPSAPDDTTRVRFHTGQIVEAEAFVTDEDIAFALSEGGSWQRAVIMTLKLIIARLSQPDFTADWLKVSNAEARKGYQAILTEKRQEFGVPAISGRGQAVYRGDSLQTDVPEPWQ